MAKSEIMDLTVVSQSFPEIVPPLISRENFLDTLDTIFDNGTELIVVEGMEGIGKTILLAQFAIRHLDYALSLFIRPTSRWAYDPEVLRFDLCNQLNWVLHQTEIVPTIPSTQESDILPHYETTATNDAFLRNSLLALQKRARYHKNAFYFVVDGLDDVPEESAYIRDLVLDMLPLGLPGFRFLLSGDLGKLPKTMLERIRYKSWTPSGFTLNQATEYLGDIVSDREIIKEIYPMWGKIPGHLATIRRILQAGTSIQALREGNFDEFSDLFQIEWHKVQLDNPAQIDLLAIIAHDRKRHSVGDLARILDLDADLVQQLLQDLSFISIDQENCEVTFVSEDFRRFASEQLRHLRDRVSTLMIDDLFRNPDSALARQYLPDYLKQAGRLEDILDYLSPEHFPRMIELSQSLSNVKRQANLGLDAARQLHRDADLVRFSLQKSTMNELGGSRVWRSEIKTRMALNDYESAMALAQSTVIVEERLHLLSIIARSQREQGLSAEPDLTEQIRHLYHQIDAVSLGEYAIDIATDLLYSSPDLAIELVERSTNTDVDENAMDWAFAKLSVAALGAEKEQYQNADTAENIRSRIKDPKAIRFSTEASLLTGRFTADEVITMVGKLEGADDRLYLLRRWTLSNREREDAIKVVEFALDLAVKVTPYSPNARVFREIATPLPFISDELQTRNLVRRFDGQKGSLEKSGPTEDFVRLQLILAHAESQYDFDAACDRLTDVYLYIGYLDDAVVKAGCMARLVTTLATITSEMTSSKDELCLLSQDDLESDVQRILDNTAEHYYVTRNVIRALAKTKPDIAFKLAQSLNTESRRNLALLELIKSALQVPQGRLDLLSIGKAISRLSDQSLKDEMLLEVVKRLANISGKAESVVEQVLPLLHQIQSIQSEQTRCKVCCFAYSFLASQDSVKCSGFLNHLLHLLEGSWRSIDVGWHKVDIGFQIVQSLAKHSLEAANMYLKWTEDFRAEITLAAEPAALAYIGCLRLATRAFGGLLARRLDSTDDLDTLRRLIDHVPSNGVRADLWAELAIRYYINGRVDECKRVVAEHVKTNFERVSTKDIEYRARIMAAIAPALYCAHARTAIELTSQLPLPQRDVVYSQICRFIFRKQIPSDPYELSPNLRFSTTYEDIIDLCDLADKIDSDTLIYQNIQEISTSVVAGPRKDRFTQQQRSDIADRLEKLIDTKLPNQRHIKHEGYKIAAQAQVARIRKSEKRVWVNLLESTRLNVSNIADRALVLTMIAVAMPNKEAALRQEILEEVKNLIGQIPSILDKIDRYVTLAFLTLNADSSIAKESLKLAIGSAMGKDEPEIQSVQRRIIDIAYNFIDKDFAASLASIVDDDPARIKTRAVLQDRRQILDLKNKAANELISIDDLDKSDKSQLGHLS